MTKEELISKLNTFGDSDRYMLDDASTLAPNVLSYGKGKWMLSRVDERYNQEVVRDFTSKEEAYDYIYQDELNYRKWREELDAQSLSFKKCQQHIHTIVTEVPGEGFVMTKTDRVYIPPEDETDSSKK